MTDELPEIIPLAPGRRRLGQDESAVYHRTVATTACPEESCAAPIGSPCHRPGIDGHRYETRTLHPRRITAAVHAGLDAQEANADAAE